MEVVYNSGKGQAKRWKCVQQGGLFQITNRFKQTRGEEMENRFNRKRHPTYFIALFELFVSFNCTIGNLQKPY